MYKRIRDLREDKDLSQQHVAEYLGCTQTCYSKYELGSRSIPIESLVRLAFFYETSVDYLLELTDSTKPYPRSKRRAGRGRL